MSNEFKAMGEVLKNLLIIDLGMIRLYAAHYGKSVWFVVTVLLVVWWLV